MKTIVYQSYRTFNVPTWIEKCMETVKKWAKVKGFDYEFIDDRLFEYVPKWYAEKSNNNILLISDLARLELAKEYLGKEYDRTIWVDADIVVFDIDNFKIDITEEFAFCREIWVDKLPNNKIRYGGGINNAVTVFTKKNSMLEFYIYACKSLVKNKAGNIDKFDVGTRFLSSLYPNVYFQLMTNVGLFSPYMMWSIATDKSDFIEQYMKKFKFPMQAANLCSSLKNTHYNDGDYIYNKVFDNLINTKGKIVNQHIQR